MTADGPRLPDLTGRLALVTGASNGVGREIARALARAGAEVLMPVRDRSKGESAVDVIRASVPNAQLELLDLDLTRLDSVRALTALLRVRDRPIDLTILNAGLVNLGNPHRHVTGDGFELHFQTNFLGHAVLTLGILPLLRGGRLVSQLSIAARTGRLDPSNPQLHRGYSALRAYGASKIALGAFSLELARRSAADDLGITVHLCHPGVVPDTGIAATLRAAHGNRPIPAYLQALSNTPEAAAHPALLAAVTDAHPPSFFTPHRPGQFAGRAVRSPLYRTLRNPGHGAITWRWAEVGLTSS